MDKRGITLVELLIVVAIIGILAAIAIPSYVGQQKRAARAEAFANLEALRLLEEQYYAENGEYARADATASGTIYYKVGDTSIQSYLPGFKPGPPANLLFDYEIAYTVAANRTTAFTAKAKGKVGTRVAGDEFTINQNNEKNF